MFVYGVYVRKGPLKTWQHGRVVVVVAAADAYAAAAVVMLIVRLCLR